MPVEVGVGYVSVVPETRGFGRLLDQQISGDAAQVGQSAGQESGRQFLGGIGGILKGGALAIAAGAGALFAAGFVEAVAQDKSNAKLGAQMGLSEKESARLGKVAGSVYSKGYGESIDQVNLSLKELAQNGVTAVNAPKKDLEGLSKSALNLAETFDADVGGAARAAGQMMKTGLAANGKEAFDLITRGFQTGADKAGDLLDTLNEYGTQFRDLGLTGPQSIGLLTQGLKAGARDADIVADALKEFAIRAKDGSDTSAAGFKAIGLNAEKMTATFAKGGPGAAAALDTVLDRLRAVKDPAKQSQTAVALFGTQAEDLQDSLFALDPSKATAALGKVGGAADKMGKTLHGSATASFEVFKRKALQGVVGFMERNVLPKVAAFGSFLISDVLPPLQTVGGAIETVLVPAVTAVGSAFAAGVGWLEEYGAWLLPVAVGVAGLTLTLNASAIATAAVTAVFSIYRGVLIAAAAVTRGYAIAQGILNAVMTANPIGLIVTGIAVLITLLVVAYNKSETFRKVVQAAWSGIQFGWDLLWNYYLKPGLTAAMWYLRLLGDIGMWLWNNALSPAFSAIMTAGKILFTVIAFLVIAPLVLAFKVLGAIGSWLWTNAIRPAFNAIAAAGRWLYDVVLKPAFDNMMLTFRAVGAIGKWLWNSVFSPVFTWIGDKAAWLWNDKIKPAWDLFKIGIGLVGDKIKDLWNTYAKPVFGFIGDKAKWLWDKALKPAFDFMKKGVEAVGQSFEDAKDFIGRAWSKVQDIARKPIRFVIERIYNAGVVPLWNKIASAFGAPEIKAMPLPKGFKTGGVYNNDVLPGYTPGRDPHHFYSPTGGRLDMSGGESIMRPEFTRGAGAGFVHSMNRIAKSRGAEGVRRALAPALGGQPQQRFADGGIFGWIGKKVAGAGSAVWDKVKAGTSWLKDGIEASARAGVKNVVDPLLKNFPGADTGFGKMIRRIPNKMIDSLFGYSKKADKKGGSTFGGKGTADALRWAKTQHGLPYQWGGNGNPSWDCSGFLSAIESVMRGQKPHRRWATMAFNGETAPPGWKRGQKAPFMVGITNSGVGHTAGTINGVNVESRGGDGVIVGPRARSYKSSLFTDWYGLKGYGNGGRPRPGELAIVGEHGPEFVRFGGGSPQVYDNRTSMEMARRMTTVPVTTPRADPDAGGFRDGQPVAIILPDGSQLDGYIDTRVDAGLDTARRRRRAGVKDR
ncbi:phage tail tape measure protein [Streptomyces chryseus]|uniref:phage tail tape measure protein n=1 Tax=Streptomyces chryseus TaxID=68186 RepID=UPI00110FF23C|nr:phage tail tape measure protein [Streptomyces chryseus]GGX01883.1 hypothetical protein GCM10010353_16870 [Streptomyces chryseus]